MELTHEKRFLSKKETATLLNVDINTLNRFIEEGHLPVAKIGKQTYRIDLQDIEACFEKLKHTK